MLEYDWNITGILLDILMGSWKSRLDITWIRFGAIGADCSKVPVQVNSGAARREGEGGALFFFRCKRAGCSTNGVQKSIMSIM